MAASTVATFCNFVYQNMAKARHFYRFVEFKTTKKGENAIKASKNLQKSSAIQKISVTLSSVIIANLVVLLCF